MTIWCIDPQQRRLEGRCVYFIVWYKTPLSCRSAPNGRSRSVKGSDGCMPMLPTPPMSIILAVVSTAEPLACIQACPFRSGCVCHSSRAESTLNALTMRVPHSRCNSAVIPRFAWLGSVIPFDSDAPMRMLTKQEVSMPRKR